LNHLRAKALYINPNTNSNLEKSIPQTISPATTAIIAIRHNNHTKQPVRVRIILKLRKMMGGLTS